MGAEQSIEAKLVKQLPQLTKRDDWRDVVRQFNQVVPVHPPKSDAGPGGESRSGRETAEEEEQERKTLAQAQARPPQLRKRQSVIGEDVKVDKKAFVVFAELLHAQLEVTERQIVARDRRNHDKERGDDAAEHVEVGEDMKMLLAACQRLFQEKHFYAAIAKNSIQVFVDALQLHDDAVVLDALKVMRFILLCQVRGERYRARRPDFEREARVAFRECGGHEVLVMMLHRYALTDAYDIVWRTYELLAMLLGVVGLPGPRGAFVLPTQTTSTFGACQHLTHQLKPITEDLIMLQTRHADAKIRTMASWTLQGILLHSQRELTKKMQLHALRKGIVLCHFFFAVDKRTGERRHSDIDINATDASIRASRNLLSLLCDDFQAAQQVILSNLPRGLVANRPPHPFPFKLEFTHKLTKQQQAADNRTTRMRYSSGSQDQFNWHEVFQRIDRMFKSPDLVWNRVLKSELCVALRHELRDWAVTQRLQPDADWDNQGFEVSYPALDGQLRVGDYFIRLLLPVLDNQLIARGGRRASVLFSFDNENDDGKAAAGAADAAAGDEATIPTRDGNSSDNDKFQLDANEVPKLVVQLFHHAVVEDEPKWKLGCLRTMSALFKLYPKQLETFEPLPYLVWLTSPKHADPMFRDHVLPFLHELIEQFPHNARRFLDAKGLQHVLHYIREVHHAHENKNSSSGGGDDEKQQQQKEEKEQEEEEEQEQQQQHINNNNNISGIKKTSEQQVEQAQRLVDDAVTRAAEEQQERMRLTRYHARSPSVADLMEIEHMFAGVNVLDIVPRRLTTLEVTHKSLDIVQCILDKAPRLRKVLSQPQLLYTLTDALLSEHDDVVDRSLQLLMTLLQASQHRVPHLLESGVFLNVVYAMRRRCTPLMAEFVAKYHLLQSTNAVPRDHSAMEFFVPLPVTRALRNGGAAKFLELMKAETHEPQFVWNSELRAEMAAQAERHTAALRLSIAQRKVWNRKREWPPAGQRSRLLQSVKEARRGDGDDEEDSDAQGPVDRTGLPVFQYPSLEALVRVGPMYLRLFNKDPKTRVDEPEFFLRELVDALVDHYEAVSADNPLVASKEEQVGIVRDDNAVNGDEAKHDDGKIMVRSRSSSTLSVSTQVLMEHLYPNRRRVRSVDEVRHICAALLAMLRRFTKFKDAYDFRATKELMWLIRDASSCFAVDADDEDKHGKQKLLFVLLEVVYALLTMKIGENRASLVAHDVCGALHAVFESIRGGSEVAGVDYAKLSTPDAVEILLQLLRCWRPLSFMNAAVYSRLASEPDMLRNVIALCQFEFANKQRDLCVAALKCLDSFSESPQLVPMLLELGAPIYVVELAIYCYPPTNDGDDAKEQEKNKNKKKKKTIDEAADAVGLAAVGLLSSWMGQRKVPLMVTYDAKHALAGAAEEVDGKEQHDDVGAQHGNVRRVHPARATRADLQRVLRTLLTPGLVRLLGDPKQFLLVSRQQSSTPHLVWNADTRRELWDYLWAQADIVARTEVWPFWTEEAFREFRYATLAPFEVVDDIFLSNLNAIQGAVDFDALDRDPESFVCKLIARIQDLSSMIDLKRAVAADSDGGGEDGDAKQQDARNVGYTKKLCICAVTLSKSLEAVPALAGVAQRTGGLETVVGLLRGGHSVDLKESILKVLTRFVAHSATRAFMVSYVPDFVSLMFCHRADPRTDLPSIGLVLRVLTEMAMHNDQAATLMTPTGMVVAAMACLVFPETYSPAQRNAAARLLGVLCVSKDRNTALEVLHALFADTFTDVLLIAAAEPRRFVEFYDETHDTPELFWNDGCREALRDHIKAEMSVLRNHYYPAYQAPTIDAKTQPDRARSLNAWNWMESTSRYDCAALLMQMRVDGIYIDAYNRNPYTKVDSARFVPALIDAVHRVHEERLSSVPIASVQPEPGQKDEFDEKDDVEEVHSNQVGHDEQEHELENDDLARLLTAISHVVRNVPQTTHFFLRDDELSFLFSLLLPTYGDAVRAAVLDIATLMAVESAIAEGIARFRLIKFVVHYLREKQDDWKLQKRVLLMMQELVRRSSLIVDHIKRVGGLVLALQTLLHDESQYPNESRIRDQVHEARLAAANLLGSMVNDERFGHHIVGYVRTVLTYEFASLNVFQRLPEGVLQFVDSDHVSRTDSRQWNAAKRAELCALFAQGVKRLDMLSWRGKSSQPDDLWNTDEVFGAGVWPRVNLDDAKDRDDGEDDDGGDNDAHAETDGGTAVAQQDDDDDDEDDSVEGEDNGGAGADADGDDDEKRRESVIDLDAHLIAPMVSPRGKEEDGAEGESKSDVDADDDDGGEQPLDDQMDEKHNTNSDEPEEHEQQERHETAKDDQAESPVVNSIMKPPTIDAPPAPSVSADGADDGSKSEAPQLPPSLPPAVPPRNPSLRAMPDHDVAGSDDEEDVVDDSVAADALPERDEDRQAML